MTPISRELQQKTGLDAAKLETIRSLIGADRRVRRVRLFGSRAKGTWREGSDIDLAVQGEGIDRSDASRWAEELEEALFPWSVDVVIVDETTDQELIDHIDRVSVDI